METKTCTACKKEKPLAEFHRFGSAGGRVGNWCEPCYMKSSAGKKSQARKQAHPQRS